jgi:hypothetical protein
MHTTWIVSIPQEHIPTHFSANIRNNLLHQTPIIIRTSSQSPNSQGTPAQSLAPLLPDSTPPNVSAICEPPPSTPYTNSSPQKNTCNRTIPLPSQHTYIPLSKPFSRYSTLYNPQLDGLRHRN